MVAVAQKHLARARCLREVFFPGLPRLFKTTFCLLGVHALRQTEELGAGNCRGGGAGARVSRMCRAAWLASGKEWGRRSGPPRLRRGEVDAVGLSLREQRAEFEALAEATWGHPAGSEAEASRNPRRGMLAGRRLPRKAALSSRVLVGGLSASLPPEIPMEASGRLPLYRVWCQMRWYVSPGTRVASVLGARRAM